MAGQLAQTWPGQILLVVELYSEGFFLRVIGPDGHDAFRCEVDQKFWGEITQFAAAAPKACGAPSWLTKPVEERREAVRAVARYGSELFQLLMPSFEDRQKFRQLVRENDEERPLIVAVDKGALIPWEVLHLAEPDDPLDYRNFLGWSHVILRLTNSGHRTRKIRSRPVNIAKVVEDDGLPTVGTGKAKLARERYPGASYAVLETLARYPQDVQKFHDFLFPEENQSVDLIHFDCHVSLDALGSVRVASDFNLPVSEFDPERLTIGHVPFVFFNGCHGGTVGPGKVVSIASRLRAAGAAGVLASESVIADDFAATFAETFYSVAATSTNVGCALLETRQRLLGHDLNPLALFYGFYGDADIVIQVDRWLLPEPGSALAERMAWTNEAA